MENNNVVMCCSLQKKQKHEEGSNGEQQCGNVSLPAEETEGKHRTNWHHFISTPSMLNE